MNYKKEFQIRTAFHEVGHALFYILNGWEFEYLSVRPTDRAHGHVRTLDYESIIWSNLVFYYFDQLIEPEHIRALKRALKQHIEISLAGELCSLFYQHRNKNTAFEELISSYRYYLEELRLYNVIDDLILIKKVPNNKDRRKKVKVFAGFNAESLYNWDEYADIDGDFLESYLALSLYYRRNDKQIINYYKKIAQETLEKTEVHFGQIEYLSSVLQMKKRLTYEQFTKYYNSYK